MLGPTQTLVDSSLIAVRALGKQDREEVKRAFSHGQDMSIYAGVS